MSDGTYLWAQKKVGNRWRMYQVDDDKLIAIFTSEGMGEQIIEAHNENIADVRNDYGD